MAVENKRMWQRGALEADLLAADEVPADREMIVASDTGRVWPGDGVSPLSARPFLVTADPMTGQMPDDVREVIAANLADPTTPEGGALAELIADATNTTQSAFLKTRAAMGKANTGTGTFKVLCIGDSITAGTGATTGSISTGSFPARLAAALISRGMPSGGTGTVWATQNANPLDSRWTFTGFTPFEPSMSFIMGASSAGATATFASERSGELVDIIYAENSGPFTYQVDSAAAVAVGQGDGSKQNWKTITVSGLANTAHTVKITTTSATAFNLGGIGVRRNIGVTVEDAGNGGADSTTWHPSQQWYRNGPTVQVSSSQRDIIFIESTLVNDVTHGISAADHQDNLTDIINKWKLVGDVVVWVPPQSSTDLIPTDTFSQYRAAAYAAAANTGVPVVDISARWGTWATANSLGYMTDTAHPTSAGYDDIARCFAAMLFA